MPNIIVIYPINNSMNDTKKEDADLSNCIPITGDHERQDGPGHTLGFLELSRHIQNIFGRDIVPDISDKSYCLDPNWYIEAQVSDPGDYALCYCAQPICYRFLLKYKGIYDTSMLIGSECMKRFENPELVMKAEADMAKAKKKRKRKKEKIICRQCAEPLLDLRSVFQKEGLCDKVCQDLFLGIECATCQDIFIPGQSWMKNCTVCYRRKKNNQMYYYCPLCQTEFKAFKVKKEGMNKGRWFTKPTHTCVRGESWKWLKVEEIETRRF